MLNQHEIYWDQHPASAVRATFTEDEVILLFEGKDSEYRSTYSGRIQLKLNTDLQTVIGQITYDEMGAIETATYELTGAFEDNSWEFFEGTWTENDESSTFDALLESPIVEEVSVESEDEVENSQENGQENQEISEVETEIEVNTPRSRHGGERQRAVRGDARVRKIQRSMELYYGLPQGSVRIVNPDRSIIHPSAKIRTVRERWTFDE